MEEPKTKSTGSGRLGSSAFAADADAEETNEWLEEFDSVLFSRGPQRGQELVQKLIAHARQHRQPISC